MRATTLASNHESPGSRTTSSSNRTDSAIELDSNQLSSHSSSNSRDEVSQLTTSATIRSLQPHPPAPSHSSLLYGRRERPILPSGQSTVNIEYDRQEIRRPSPPAQITEQHIMPSHTSSQRVAMPGLTNMQTMDNYSAHHFFGTELTATGSAPSPTTDDWLRASEGDSGIDGNTSWESLEISVFDWSIFDIEGNNGQPHTGTSDGN